MIVQGLVFDAKDLCKIPMASPLKGEICDFPPISRYISETVQDMDIVTLMVLFTVTLHF